MTDRDARIRCAEVYGGNASVDESLVVPGLDIWLFARPAEGAHEGGDVVFVSVCGKGQLAKAYLADVAGHGPEVAPAGRAIRSLVRAHLDDPDHGAFLRAVNQTAAAGSLSGLFATMVAAAWHPESGRLSYAYAGHPRILRRRAGADRFEVLEADHCPIPGAPADMALGIITGASWFQSDVAFEEGDVAFLYSDGWEDAKLEGGRPGLDGLLERLNACPVTSAEALRTALLDLYREEKDRLEFADDVSFLVLRRAEPA